MKGILERLEAKGYVRTAFDSRDGRVKNVYLTDAVKRDKRRVQALLVELDEQVLQGLGEKEIANLHTWLEKMYANIS